MQRARGHLAFLKFGKYEAAVEGGNQSAAMKQDTPPHIWSAAYDGDAIVAPRALALDGGRPGCHVAETFKLVFKVGGGFLVHMIGGIGRGKSGGLPCPSVRSCIARSET